MFSDESTFRCGRAIQVRVRRPSSSSRFDLWYTVKTVKHLKSMCCGVPFLVPVVEVASSSSTEI
jgi:hypothetical protein